MVFFWSTTNIKVWLWSSTCIYFFYSNKIQLIFGTENSTCINLIFFRQKNVSNLSDKFVLVFRCVWVNAVYIYTFKIFYNNKNVNILLYLYKKNMNRKWMVLSANLVQIHKKQRKKIFAISSTRFAWMFTHFMNKHHQ